MHQDVVDSILSDKSDQIEEQGSLLAALSDCSMTRTAKDCIKVVLEDGNELQQLLEVLFRRDKATYAEVVNILKTKHLATRF